MDRERSTSRQRERELKARQSHSLDRTKVTSRLYDDESSDSRATFAEVVIQPLSGTTTFNKANPSLNEALEQNQRAKREIAKSS